MMTKFSVAGLRSQTGEQYVEISEDGKVKAIVPRALFREPNADKRRYLWDREVAVATDSALNSLTMEVNKIARWEPVAIASEPGWNGPGIFVCLDGEVVASPDQCAFLNATDQLRPAQRSGDLPKWRKYVAGRLEGQPIPIFALAFSFVAPLLDLTSRNMNVGFSFFGPAASGKTTLQQLAASVWGPPTRNALHPFMITSHTTLNGLEDTMRDHRDHPVIMDELALLSNGSSSKKKASDLQAFSYKLASGHEKTRFGDRANSRPFNFTILLSSNEPLSYFLDGGETDNAARQRILDIPISDERPHQIFDHIPEKFAGGYELATALIESAERNHGKAGPRFVNWLVAARAAEPKMLRKRIKMLISEFQEIVVGSAPKGRMARISQAFGMVYAAGKLAQECNSLPSKLDIHASVAACYRLHLGHETEFPPFRERVEALRDDPGTQRWKKTLPNKVFKAKVIYYTEKKHPEIWVRTEAIEEVFPDWWAIRNSTDVEALLVKEGEHYATHRFAGKQLARERIHVFRLKDG